MKITERVVAPAEASPYFFFAQVRKLASSPSRKSTAITIIALPAREDEVTWNQAIITADSLSAKIGRKVPPVFSGPRMLQQLDVDLKQHGSVEIEYAPTKR